LMNLAFPDLGWSINLMAGNWEVISYSAPIPF
jgi:hypothetical protein